MAGAQEFLGGSGPQDEFLLAYAAVNGAVAVPLTTERARVRAGLDVPARAGGAAVIDAKCEALRAMKSSRHATRALGGLLRRRRQQQCLYGGSDGGGRSGGVMPGVFSSRRAPERILPAARETGAISVFVGNVKPMESAIAAVAV